MADAVQGDAPAALLSKLSSLVIVNSAGQIATVLCAMIDAPAHRIPITSAGHLPASMISNGRAELLGTEVGLMVGLDPDVTYQSANVLAPAGATVLALTDGLAAARPSTRGSSASAPA